MAGKKEKDPLKELDARLLKGIIQIFLLQMIKNGHSHGYELMKICCSPEDKKVSSGLLYSTLNGLEKDGYLNSKWVHDKTSNPRKKYSITSKGDTLLEKGSKLIKRKIQEIMG